MHLSYPSPSSSQYYYSLACPTLRTPLGSCKTVSPQQQTYPCFPAYIPPYHVAPPHSPLKAALLLLYPSSSSCKCFQSDPSRYLPS
eukprot:747611-Hanusia_phi.AAC.1